MTAYLSYQQSGLGGLKQVVYSDCWFKVTITASLTVVSDCWFKVTVTTSLTVVSDCTNDLVEVKWDWIVSGVSGT